MEEDCKAWFYNFISQSPHPDFECAVNMKLGRGLSSINGFGLVASRNKVMHCIVNNTYSAPEVCHAAGGETRQIKSLFLDVDLDFLTTANVRAQFRFFPI